MSGVCRAASPELCSGLQYAWVASTALESLATGDGAAFCENQAFPTLGFVHFRTFGFFPQVRRLLACKRLAQLILLVLLLQFTLLQLSNSFCFLNDILFISFISSMSLAIAALNKLCASCRFLARFTLLTACRN